jgi:hypothetical protein
MRIPLDLAQVYRVRLADLRTSLEHPRLRAEAIEIIRGLIDRVVVHPVDGNLEVELVGEIAGMVNLSSASENRTAVPRNGFVCDRCEFRWLRFPLQSVLPGTDSSLPRKSFRGAGQTACTR